MNQLRGTLQEKDSLIIDLNKNLKKQNEDMSELRVSRQNLEKEKSKLEKLIEEVKKDLMSKDQEIKSLQLRVDSVAGKSLTDQLASSQESGLGTPDNSSHRDGGTLSRRSAEVDRLRRELSMMRRERDDLVAEVKQLRTKLEKLRKKEDGPKRDQPEGLIGLPTGNAYAKAIAAQQTTTKISLLNEHISNLNRTNVELKLHNESLHNTVIDLQRRYRSLKEQYEGEQEAWLTERVVLESKAKEQEDRKLTINNTRKLLQETTAKLYEVEANADQKLQQLQIAYQNLENEKLDLEGKLNQIEEHQKLPKVLQRFGGSAHTSRAGVLSPQTRTANGEAKDLTRRLESAERTMECYRQQCELFRHRHFEVEENAEREFKVWQEEREHLLYRAEEARAMIEQWSMQLQYRTDTDTEKAEDVVKEVLTQMEKWCANRGKVPCLKRRMVDSLYSFDGGSSVTGLGSIPASPAASVTRGGLMGSSTTSPFPPSRSQAQRSTSMEWGNGRSVLASGTSLGGHYREGSVGLGGSTFGGALRGSALSLAMGNNVGGGSNYSLIMANRCGRSVSPEVSVRKKFFEEDKSASTTSLTKIGQSKTESKKPVTITASTELSSKPPIPSHTEAKTKTDDAKPTTPKAPEPGKNEATRTSSTAKPVEEKASALVVTKTKHGSSIANRIARWASPGPKSSSKSALSTTSSSQTSSEGSTKKTEKDSKTQSTVSSAKSDSSTKVKQESSKSKDESKTTMSDSKTALTKDDHKSPVKEESKKSSKQEEVKATGKDDNKSTKKEESKQTASKDHGTSTTKVEVKSTKTDSKPPSLSHQISTPPGSTPTGSQAPKRSGSVSTISPAIMALRQKFAGGAK
ncbi:unnamed protein product [Echinostoma caproni]|uniref:C2-C2_1 domain-containing protein n=1 Tax=Echinostoma caproni TaxID=27848 RepID=A0A183AR53_9TREM|nr:unnamed protein product [Echinostoma caproni]